MKTHVFSRKSRGQAIVLIAGAIVALLALVALAVDGGNAYAQRRIAQNAVDQASMAGAAKMQDLFMANRYFDANTNSWKVSPMTATQNAMVLDAIKSILQANNANTSPVSQGGDMDLYYLDVDGSNYSSASPLSVASVPFAGGAGPGAAGVAGVFVRTSVSSATYFARVIGVDTVKAGADGAVMIGGVDTIVPNSVPGPQNTAGRLWPITIFMDTVNLTGVTTLYNFDTKYGPGNWGELCYMAPHGNCGQADLTSTQYPFGFDVSRGLDGNLETNNGGTLGVGADAHYTFFPVGWDGANHNTSGFWINAHTGNAISSACSTIKQAGREHWTVFIPVSDMDNGGNGSNQLYHAVNVGAFRLTETDCPGSSTYIKGSFIGWGFSAANATYSRDLNRAAKNGLLTIKIGR